MASWTFESPFLCLLVRLFKARIVNIHDDSWHITEDGNSKSGFNLFEIVNSTDVRHTQERLGNKYGHTQTHHLWSHQESKVHINVLELKLVWLAHKVFLPLIKDSFIQILMVNSTGTYYKLEVQDQTLYVKKPKDCGSGISRIKSICLLLSSRGEQCFSRLTK